MLVGQIVGIIVCCAFFAAALAGTIGLIFAQRGQWTAGKTVYVLVIMAFVSRGASLLVFYVLEIFTYEIEAVWALATACFVSAKLVLLHKVLQVAETASRMSGNPNFRCTPVLNRAALIWAILFFNVINICLLAPTMTFAHSSPHISRTLYFIQIEFSNVFYLLIASICIFCIYHIRDAVKASISRVGYASSSGRRVYAACVISIASWGARIIWDQIFLFIFDGDIHLEITHAPALASVASAVVELIPNLAILALTRRLLQPPLRMGALTNAAIATFSRTGSAPLLAKMPLN